MQRFMPRAFTAGLLALLILSAKAEGADAGQSGGTERGWQIGAAGLFCDFQLDGRAIDDSSVGFKSYGQYRFNRYLGVELAWLNSGDFEEDASPSDADASVSVRGFSLDIVGYLPWSVGPVQVFGKAGFSSLSQDLELDGANVSTRKADSLTAGGGADFAFADRWSLRIEGDWYGLDTADFWTAGLGISYHFGAP